MAKAIKWSKSYSELATFYDCSISALKHWAKQGVNLDDAGLVTPLVASWKVRNGEKSTSAAIPLDIKVDSTLGLLGSVQRAREVEVALFKRYTDAAKIGDPNTSLFAKEWAEASDHLRKIEKDSPDVQAANKKSVSVDDVATTLNKLFVRLRTSLEGLPTRVTKDVPQEFAVVVLNNIRHEVNHYIEELYRCPLLEADGEE